MIFNPRNYTTVFLSYDEPNCEDNYKHLLTLCPNAKRVHGITGSDNAHKEVAKLSETENVIVVDGDNKVKSYFYNSTLDLPENTDLSTSVLSFSGYNTLNGNSYGNGGIKVWPTELLKNMQTHENGDKKSVDFNLSNYIELNTVGSDVIINSTPLQAFRAGIREGVKLSLDPTIDWRNYDRLWRWMHIGSDMKNGIWAIYGARFGYFQMLLDWDYSCIKNAPYLNYKFDQLFEMYHNYIESECNRIGSLIRVKTNDKNIVAVFSDTESIEYRNNIPAILRSPEVGSEYDIVFVNNDEPNSESNYEKLVERFPRAKRVHNIGLTEIAKVCRTDYFWVVDGNSEIIPEFNFDYVVPFFEQPKARKWCSKNPINGLVDYNGVRLIPRTTTIRKPLTEYEHIPETSTILRFNTDPFSTWKNAFKESCRLVDDKDKLQVWCTIGANERFGEYAIEGAIAGRNYGLLNKKKPDELRKVEELDWLLEKFNNQYV